MFQLTIAVILAVFILDLSLSILNYNYRKMPIPLNVSDVYNEADYKKWLDYTMEVFKISILTKIMSTSVLILFLVFNGFPALARVPVMFSSDQVLQILIFFGIYLTLNFILGIGFRVYRTFNIEERYGFNRTTVKTFILDQVKSILLTLTLGGGLLYLLLYLYLRLGNKSLIYAWLIIIVLILVINVLYTNVFIRLFNKITPLPEGELYEKSTALANTMGYKIKKISIMDASKRSSRLNAFFSGFGRFKSIILYDTLLKKCTTDEIISVLAHEIGHAKHKDVLKNLLISMVQMAVHLAILSYFLSSTAFSTAFGFSEIHLGFASILFIILFEPLGIMMNIPMSALSRKAEYKADACAAEVGYKDAMISALKILAKENFSNLTPHPLVVKLTYSHPPVSQRIQALQKNE